MMSFLECWMYPATDDIRLVKGSRVSREPRRAKDMGVLYVDPKILLQVLCHLRVGKALGNIWNFIFFIAPRENPSWCNLNRVSKSKAQTAAQTPCHVLPAEHCVDSETHVGPSKRGVR